MEALGHLQIEVMHFLWTNGPATVKQVMTALNHERPKTLAYTTFLSRGLSGTGREISGRYPIPGESIGAAQGVGSVTTQHGVCESCKDVSPLHLYRSDAIVVMPTNPAMRSHATALCFSCAAERGFPFWFETVTRVAAKASA